MTDVDLLVSWHADPEVARYWEWETFTQTFTQEEMRERLTSGDVDSQIVEIDGEPVGYLQAWCEEGTRDEGGLTCSSSRSPGGEEPDLTRLGRSLVRF